MPKILDVEMLKTIYDVGKEEVDEMKLKTGEIIGERYEIVKMVGCGAMGVVYEVKDKKLKDYPRALKIMLGKLVKEEKARQRFINEILISQNLTHKNILRVYDYGEHKNLLYYTMEYIAGKNMQEWMEEKQGKANWEEVWEIARQILEGLEVAHEETIHRDIKPANILLSAKGNGYVVKICDFGVAQLIGPKLKLNQSLVTGGTQLYMAPEQMSDPENIDQRADLYAVGVLVYQALTGKQPIGRFKEVSQWRKDIGENLDEAIDKALEPEREERYQSAREMLDALSELASQGRARQGQARIEREQREQQARQEEERKSREIQGAIAKEKAIPNAVQKTSEDGRYRVLSSGIIQDTKTGLEWLVGPDKDTTWDEAKAWVESIPASQYGSGWRMPTRKELPTIYEKGKGKCNIDTVFVSPREYLYVWTGELGNANWWKRILGDPSSSSAWSFDFHDGCENWYDRSFSYANRVFAVRAGRR